MAERRWQDFLEGADSEFRRKFGDRVRYGRPVCWVSAQWPAARVSSSFGGYYWDGNFNTSATASDKFQRYGLFANMNELAKGKFLLAAGFSAGKGDSAAGGIAKVRAFFGQGEYIFSDKFSMFLHVVRADPDTSVSGNESTIYTAQAFYWPSDHVNLIGRLIAVNDGSTTDKRWTISARFMY